GVDLDVPEVDLAPFTVDEEEGGLDGVFRHTDLTGPDIGGPAGNDADDSASTLGRHDAVDDMIEGAIPPIADHEIIACVGRFSCQRHRVPAEFLEDGVGLPAGGREYGQHVGQ